MKANLILSNANVLTMDPSCPIAEWVAIGNKKFLGIGENAKFGELKDAHTIVLDCKKKTILPGQFADLVVLSEDPTKVPTLEIRDIEVEMTILDGEVVWNKETSR